MPKDKNASHALVISAAKQEFLDKGFEKASMRTIAELAGMTPAGLYRHFTDKEEMFAALVQPTLDAIRQRGIHVNEIVPEERHLLLNAYYSAFFEVVAHKFSKEDAIHYRGTLKRFFYLGWRAFLGF
ncbi:MAG: TetR/AcrR family transcriptional regulator [Clostridia bacterium]|nr:TetR/AcrR family transcriptional regulator [Clostridia bacterium]